MYLGIIYFPPNIPNSFVVHLCSNEVFCKLVIIDVCTLDPPNSGQLVKYYDRCDDGSLWQKGRPIVGFGMLWDGASFRIL